jgi:S-adenosylmethionine synthetase
MDRIEVSYCTGYVKPVSTLVDLLREGRLSKEHIEKGLFDGLRTGAITRAELAAVVPGPERQQLRKWLKELE